MLELMFRVEKRDYMDGLSKKLPIIERVHGGLILASAFNTPDKININKL